MDKVFTAQFFTGIVILILGTLLLILNIRKRRKTAEIEEDSGQPSTRSRGASDPAAERRRSSAPNP